MEGNIQRALVSPQAKGSNPLQLRRGHTTAQEEAEVGVHSCRGWIHDSGLVDAACHAVHAGPCIVLEHVGLAQQAAQA